MTQNPKREDREKKMKDCAKPEREIKNKKIALLRQELGSLHSCG